MLDELLAGRHAPSGCVRESDVGLLEVGIERPRVPGHLRGVLWLDAVLVDVLGHALLDQDFVVVGDGPIQQLGVVRLVDTSGRHFIPI